MADPFTIVQQREELMVSTSSGTPSLRSAHFLEPISTSSSINDLPKPNLLKQGNPNITLKLCKKPASENKRSPTKKWKLWISILKPKYQELWKKTGIYQAILATTYEVEIDKSLILGLARKWCPHTNTFILSWGEVTITLEDVLILGGFSVCGASVLTSVLDQDFVGVLKSMRKVHKGFRLDHSGNVHPNTWMDYYMGSGNLLEHEAFLAFWLSSFVLIGSYNYIAIKVFPIAIHLARGIRIALAPAVLANIYRDMSLLKNLMTESVTLGDKVHKGGIRFLCQAPMDLVQIWVWERFSEFRPIPNVIKRDEPRVAMWHNVENLVVNDVGCALDSSRDCFVWRPYSAISYNSVLDKLYKENEQWILVESDVGIDIESFARCLRVSELVGLDSVEQYLPHRVSMQFGLDQDLVPHVTRINANCEAAWRCYSRPITGVKLYIPPRLFVGDVSLRYKDWWKNGVYSCGGKSDDTFLVSPCCASTCFKEKSIDCIEKDHLEYADVTTCKEKTASCVTMERNGNGKRRIVGDDVAEHKTLMERCSAAIDGTCEKLKCVSRTQCSFKGLNQRAKDGAHADPQSVNMVDIEEESNGYNAPAEVAQRQLETRIRKLEVMVNGLKSRIILQHSGESVEEVGVNEV